MKPSAVVLGNGAFGNAMALLLVETGHEVTIWGHDAEYLAEVAKTRENRRFLPGVILPAELRWSTEVTCASGKQALVVSAIPTRYLRSVLEKFRGHLNPRTPIVSVTKGIEVGTLKRPTQVLREHFPRNPLLVLSGPSHAEEVARRIPSSVVLASRAPSAMKRVQRAFNTEKFRVYANLDPVGVELAGALKNVIALAAGILDGLGLGDNAKSALVTRGLVEIARLGCTLGARRQTFAGLAGMGDLITTSFSKHGRNRAVGERLGRGEKLDSILASMSMVAEGVTTTEAAWTLAREHKVDMPITREVYAFLFEGKSPEAAVHSLMTRAAKSEGA